jgi:hypothetical protein
LTVKGGNKCNNWPHLPFGLSGATGGLIGDSVIICGGRGNYSNFDECYSLTSEKATLVTNMFVGRFYAASIVLNDDTLWVTGGYAGLFYIASTEYVTEAGTMLGPDLPMTLCYHAMVAINSTCSMVIGGISTVYSALTFFYDHNKAEWITGPSLMQARGDHAAGIITDEVTDENFVVVTGGDLDSTNHWEVDWTFGLDSTEILQDDEWVEGKIKIPWYVQTPFFWHGK